MPILCGNFSALLQSTFSSLGIPWKVGLYNHGYDNNLSHVVSLVGTASGIYVVDGMFGHIIVDQEKTPKRLLLNLSKI